MLCRTGYKPTNVAGPRSYVSRLKILDATRLPCYGMKRSAWLVIAINVYGITAAVLAILCNGRTRMLSSNVMASFHLEGLRTEVDRTSLWYARKAALPPSVS